MFYVTTCRQFRDKRIKEDLETRESKKKERFDISCTHLIKARWQANGSAINIIEQ